MMIQSKTNNHLSLITWLEALYICRDTFTDVMKTLQIKLFMQNKANFQKVKFNVTKVLTKDYDQLDTWSIGKTKPIQSQFKANQTQLKPIKCQNKPKQSQFPIILVSLNWLCIISFYVMVILCTASLTAEILTVVRQVSMESI